MKRLFSFSVASTITFILSILAILVIAVSAPGMVQAVLGPAPTSSGEAQPGNSIQTSGDKATSTNPAAQIGTLSDTGVFGSVGIGTVGPISPLHILSSTSTQPETIDLTGIQPITAQWNDYCDTGGAFSGSGFLARFARGSKASPSSVTNGDRLGFNVFGGWAGTGFKHSAAIEAIVGSGTISDTSLPTYMKFSTTPEGSTTRAERMRITPDGRVGIGIIDPTAKLDVRTDTGNGVYANTHTFNSNDKGVYGSSYYGSGVYGENGNGGSYGCLGNYNEGVYGKHGTRNNYGRLGTSSYGVYGYSAIDYAGRFEGKVEIIGSLATGFNSTTADYTITANDSILAVNASGGDVVITLPTAFAIPGRTYTIKKVDDNSSTVTVDGSGDESIDGKDNYKLAAQWKYVSIVSNGANWLVTANN